jgi:hypothetical protein
MDYSDRDAATHPVKGFSGITTEYATGALVIACLVALILIRRGFRGVGVPGVGSLNLGK